MTQPTVAAVAAAATRRRWAL